MLREPNVARSVIRVAVIGLGIAALSGCAAAPAPTAETTGSLYKACAVSGAGGWQDKSFNEQVYVGMQNAKKNQGVDTALVESKTSDDFAPGLQTLIDQGCNVVFSDGFDANDAVNAAAAANPTVDFVTVDGFVKDDTTTNLKAITYKMDQSAFLGGYAAAEHSTTHTIATFGAVQNSAITDFMTGYYKGAQQWAADNNTPTKVLGWDPDTETGTFVGDFINQVQAKTIAAGQLDQGADVLFPVAGSLFSGAAQAITDAGTKAVFIGVDSDVVETNPEFTALTLTSVEKRMVKAVEAIVSDGMNSKFNADPYVGDLENAGTGLAPFHDFEASLDAKFTAKLGELEKAIISGSVKTNVS